MHKFLKNLPILLLLAGVFFPDISTADQFMGGVGINTGAGQPNYQENRFPIYLAYEGFETWRISFTDAQYHDENNSDFSLRTQFIGLEIMKVTKIASAFSLFGSVGPGLFQVESRTTETKSNKAFGLIATGSLRIKITDSLFVDAQYAFRSAAIRIGDHVVNGGFEGLQAALGIEF